jgi:hypothetical protein
MDGGRKSDGARWSSAKVVATTGQSSMTVKSENDRREIAESMLSESRELACNSLELSTEKEELEIGIAEKSNASCRSSRIEMNSKKATIEVPGLSAS